MQLRNFLQTGLLRKELWDKIEPKVKKHFVQTEREESFDMQTTIT